jgi:hypothetical protein
MRPLVLALITFACVSAGALLGMLLGSRLPEHHADARTREVVKLGMGTIATLMALVLGLLVATAKASFDTKSGEIRDFSARVVQLDRTMRRYGPETSSARRLLKRYLAQKIDEVWPTGSHRSRALLNSNAGQLLDDVFDQLLALRPADDTQRELRTRALHLGGDLAQTRALLAAQQVGSSIPGAFLVVLVFWATVLFTSIGLFSPHNTITIGVLIVCALSIAGAILIILEMDNAFGGLITVSSAPARAALAQLSR